MGDKRQVGPLWRPARQFSRLVAVCVVCIIGTCCAWEPSRMNATRAYLALCLPASIKLYGVLWPAVRGWLLYCLR